jgi:hypothetical protein
MFATNISHVFHEPEFYKKLQTSSIDREAQKHSPPDFKYLENAHFHWLTEDLGAICTLEPSQPSERYPPAGMRVCSLDFETPIDL